MALAQIALCQTRWTVKINVDKTQTENDLLRLAREKIKYFGILRHCAIKHMRSKFSPWIEAFRWRFIYGKFDTSCPSSLLSCAVVLCDRTQMLYNERPQDKWHVREISHQRALTYAIMMYFYSTCNRAYDGKSRINCHNYAVIQQLISCLICALNLFWPTYTDFQHGNKSMWKKSVFIRTKCAFSASIRFNNCL